MATDLPFDELFPRYRRLMESVAAYRHAAIVMAGADLGLFDALAAGPRTAGETADALSLPLRGVAALLDALTALGLLVKAKGRYANGDDADQFLVEGRPFYVGNMLRHNHKQYERFGGLADVVRAGGPAPRPSRRRTDEEHRQFILSMADIGRLSARALLPLLSLRGDERILDLGGGPGAYMLLFSQEHPGLRATVFDLPETEPVARAYLDARDGGDRVAFRAGSFLADELGRDYDAVLVSNVIHMLGPADIEALFGRCRRALAAGGRIFVKDFFLSGDRTAPAGAAVFACNMFLSTQEGGSYTWEQAEGWLAGAGFGGFRRAPVTDQAGLIEAVASAD